MSDISKLKTNILKGVAAMVAASQKYRELAHDETNEEIVNVYWATRSDTYAEAAALMYQLAIGKTPTEAADTVEKMHKDGIYVIGTYEELGEELEKCGGVTSDVSEETRETMSYVPVLPSKGERNDN